MELAVDIGNSSAKMGVFNGNDIMFRATCPNDDLTALDKITSLYRITDSIVSTVAGIKGKVGSQLRSARLPHVMLNEASAPAFNARYGLHREMGCDRLAAIVEAREAYRGRFILVIDSGSCTTYKFIDANGNYLGGNISAGMFMRLQAMHLNTELLPPVEMEGPTPEIGYDTDTAIRSGGVFGATYEMEGYIRHAFRKHPDMITIVAGGSTNNIDDVGNAEIVVDRDLVLKGLIRILHDENKTANNKTEI